MNGKFSCRPTVRFITRWDVGLLEPLSFDDPVYGIRSAPTGFVSDLASIRSLREVCRYAALLSLLAWVFAWGWVAQALVGMAVIALALYGLLAGYGMRAAILHDRLYETAEISRQAADDVFYRALRADGVARWRAAIFYAGVRIGGSFSFKRGK